MSVFDMTIASELYSYANFEKQLLGVAGGESWSGRILFLGFSKGIQLFPPFFWA
jgi:hypothetical protein